MRFGAGARDGRDLHAHTHSIFVGIAAPLCRRIFNFTCLDASAGFARLLLLNFICNVLDFFSTLDSHQWLEAGAVEVTNSLLLSPENKCYQTNEIGTTITTKHTRAHNNRLRAVVLLLPLRAIRPY